MSGVLFIIIANSIIFMAVGLFQMETVLSKITYLFHFFKIEKKPDTAKIQTLILLTQMCCILSRN